MKRALVLLGVAGCARLVGIDEIVTVDRPDAAEPAERDAREPDGAPDACAAFSTQFETCGLPPGNPFTVGPGSLLYNTDTHVLSNPDGSNPITIGAQLDLTSKAGAINVLVVTTFDVAAGGTLRVTGTKPFGIVATQAITIAGRLEAHSDSARTGAGAVGACGASTPLAPSPHFGGGGGGGGGGFKGRGGDGQDGDNNEGGRDGANGGLAVAPVPNGPRGGCAGGNGGDSGGTGGIGGAGGGAVYLVSATSIAVPGGVIHAGGAGGRGGNAPDAGAGGGGAGGMILLEAPAVTLAGILAANGGGGGGGGGNNSGQRGSDAQASSVPASGAPTVNPGGPGSSGCAGSSTDGASGIGRPSAGGGGGGGACGYTSIRSANPTITGTISPPLSVLPP